MEFMPNTSSSATTTDNLAQVIASRVHGLRQAAGLSLDVLAQRSGVSRSMISAVERAQTNATALVLDRLASALGVALTQLLELQSTQSPPLSRHAEQAVWQDPTSGYLRRSLSPAGSTSRLRLIEVRFPAQARIAYEPNAAQPPIHQQIWLQQGRLDITVGTQLYRLEPGDCLAMTIDQPIVFFNPAVATPEDHQSATYLVAQS
jgi:transcriptional regulator with XRE-family HTH domain